MKGNAIRQAKTPNMERLWHENPHAVLQASRGNGVAERPNGNERDCHMTMGAAGLCFRI